MHELQTSRTPELRRNRALSTRSLRWLFLALIVTAVVSVSPQTQLQPGIPNQVGQRSQSPFNNTNPFDDESVFAHRQLNALNAERQKALVSDTAKLLKLAQELNSEVAANSSNSLTADQIRKIANIEKLARNVKQKMSESMITGPSLRDPIVPLR